MRMLLGSRGSGKTNTLIEAMAENPNAVTVVSSRREAELFLEQAQGNGYTIDPRNVLTAHDFREGRLRFLREREIYVDNVDFVLATLLGGPVAYATMTAPGNG